VDAAQLGGGLGCCRGWGTKDPLEGKLGPTRMRFCATGRRIWTLWDWTHQQGEEINTIRKRKGGGVLADYQFFWRGVCDAIQLGC